MPEIHQKYFQIIKNLITHRINLSLRLQNYYNKRNLSIRIALISTIPLLDQINNFRKLIVRKNNQIINRINNLKVNYIVKRMQLNKNVLY